MLSSHKQKHVTLLEVAHGHHKAIHVTGRKGSATPAAPKALKQLQRSTNFAPSAPPPRVILASLHVPLVRMTGLTTMRWISLCTAPASRAARNRGVFIKHMRHRKAHKTATKQTPVKAP